MKDFERKIHELLERIKTKFIGTDKIESKFEVLRRQNINRIFLILGVLISIIVLVLFLSSESDKPVNTKSAKERLNDDHKTIELASSATKGEVKWQSFLEDSIEAETNTRKEQFDLLQKTIDSSAESQKQESSKEFEEIKARLAYALKEIDNLKTVNQNLQNDITTLGEDDKEVVGTANLSLTSITDRQVTRSPVSSFNHIPATSYVSGHLLGGIAVSTSINAASEPIPVIIKLTGRGNLPAAFAVDIKQCRLLASCYGDISSERAIIRAEELVCEDKESGLLISTKVAGVIYGDDGANGIRGVVVSMSDKHLKNAFLGGVLSGFSNSAKGQRGLNISPIGIISEPKKSPMEIAREGFMSGTGSAAEKLADYHIRLAANISPVIMVPGGTKVDIMFTKSVEIGSFDVEDRINNDRARYKAPENKESGEK